MGSMSVKMDVLTSITSQTTKLVELLDLPGIVVRVWSVQFMLSSFSESVAVAHALRHDVNLGTTLSTADMPGQWAHAEQPQDSDGAGLSNIIVPFWPEPYELIGTQRWDVNLSAGTISVKVAIHYTLRKEPNKTRWNLLRARTSFERD